MTFAAFGCLSGKYREFFKGGERKRGHNSYRKVNFIVSQ